MSRPEDLILTKLVWARDSGSELQLRDVSQMLVLLNDLDKDYIKRWSEKLDVEELLKKAQENE